MRFRSGSILLAGLVVAVLASNSISAPYEPSSDDVVLERLPYKPNDPDMREIKDLRAELSSDTQNLEVAMRLAKRYFDLAGAQGDPRYIGYAQAALEPWWKLPQPPVRVLVMRATLIQYRHDFSGALEDLERALKLDPTNVAAWSLRATIHLVQANYEESRRDCTKLAPLVSELTASGCMAFIDGLTGRARQSHDALRGALDRASNVAADHKLWILLRLAEMAWRLNDARLAEEHFRRALVLDITDGFLLAAYADFLLDYGRPQEVIALLRNWTAADPLLLRLALAEQAVNAKGASEHKATLADRYAAARLRGDTTHEQEESRFVLMMQDRAEDALRLALSNWKVQREPRDARVVLDAALAARRPEAAQAVLEWRAQSGIEDWYLKRAADRINAMKKNTR